MPGGDRYILSDTPVEINAGRRRVALRVRNTGDRPIQVGSHYHFFEANRALDFQRSLALGMRLNIPAGTAVRFEPGDEKDVELVEVGGSKTTVGFNNLVDGSPLEAATARQALERARQKGFKGAARPDESGKS